jgi:hypothetical protein
MNDKRKRAAPTIDLSATEVSSTPADNTPAPDSQSPPLHESAAQPQHESTPQPPPSEQPQANSDVPTHRLSAGIYAAAIASGLIGGALVTATFAALWYSGLLPMRSVQSHDAEIAALKKQVLELLNRPAPAADNQAVDALRQRVAKIEHDIANLPPGDKTVADRLAAADNAMKSLGVALAALAKRSDDIAAKANQADQSAAAAEKAVSELRDSAKNAASQASPGINPAQLAEVQKRIAGLEQSVTAVREQIAKEIAKTPAIDSAARLALSAAALRSAVIGGAPYKTELAQVKSLGADAKAMAPLEAFAASGVQNKAALVQQLTAMIPVMLKAAGAQKAPSGFLERLQANAGSLVHIGPINAPAGDAPADVLARIEVAAAHADINGALADLGKLPAPVRAPAQAWIAKAKARQQALAAARAFAADAAGKLGKR